MNQLKIDFHLHYFFSVQRDFDLHVDLQLREIKSLFFHYTMKIEIANIWSECSSVLL